MSAQPGALPLPSARALRGAMRRARRRSGAAHSLGETLQDVYVALFAVALLVVMAGPAMSSMLTDVGRRTTGPGLGTSLAAAALLAAGGGLLRVLVLIGPVVRDPADVTWLLASPVRRRGLLAPTAVLLLGVGVVAGVLTGLGAGLVADVGGGALVPWGTGGAAAGLAVVGAAVLCQPSAPARSLARRCGDLLTAAGVVMLVAALAGLTLRRAGLRPAGGGRSFGLVVLGLAVLVVLGVLATVPRALDRLRRSDLLAGSGLALGLRATVTALDGSFFAETLRAKRLLERGTVRPRPLHGNGWSALLAADVRRVTRSPRALATCAGLLPLAWAAADLYGSLAAVLATVLVSWGAAAAVATGLRLVVRGGGLARSMPFSNSVLRGVHCIVPGCCALVVSAAATALGHQPAWMALPAALIALSGVLRTSAGRPPLKWELQASSPMGALPVGALTSYLVGIDVVALTSVPLLLHLDSSIAVGVPALACTVLLRWNRR